MKILYSWLKDFINLDGITIDELCNSLTKIGLEVENYEEYGKKINNFEGLVVGEIVECYKHPNADKLSCTKVKIDDSGNLLNIVCGAPNVKVGLKVVVATINSILKTYSGEEFKIKKSKIRGEISEGMLCAEDEIGLSNNHDCIIELDTNLKVGTPIRDVYNDKNTDENNKEQDYLINVDLTPNRGYCTSYLGIARDLKTIIKRDINDLTPDLNDKYLKDNNIEILNKDLLDIKIDNLDVCKRYCGIVLKNVNIKESSDLIKYRLQAVGVKSINNIVDLTNYIMFSYGQPMHAYDLDKIKGHVVNVKLNCKNRKFNALNKEEYNIENDIVVEDNDDILSLAGIIGCIDSSIDENTKNILLESAYFNNSYIRKSCNRLKIRTEASYRFERIVDENNTFTCILKYIENLKKTDNNFKTEGYVDLNYLEKNSNIIETDFEEIYKIIGQEIDKNIILEILKSLDIDIKINDNKIILKIPSYRKNIEFIGDIVDEILRIYGYNNLNLDNYHVKEFFNENKYEENQDKYLDLKNNFTNILCANGFNEIRTNSLVSKNDILDNDKNNIIELLNPSSNECEILRTELIFSGLNIIKYNINHNNKNLKLFEFGKIYKYVDDKIEENKRLSTFISGSENSTWQNEYIKDNNYNFFTIKKTVLNLLNSYKFKNILLNNIENEYINGLEIIINNKNIGYFGIVNDSLLKKYNINQDVFYANLYIEDILKLILNKKSIIVDEVSKFLPIKRDLSLLIDKNIEFKNIIDVIRELKDKRIKDIELFSIYESKDDPLKKTYSISFYIVDNEKNLNNDEINEIFNNVIKTCEDNLHAIIRR